MTLRHLATTLDDLRSTRCTAILYFQADLTTEILGYDSVLTGGVILEETNTACQNVGFAPPVNGGPTLTMTVVS